MESRNISQFLDLGSETLPPKAALSLASMIGAHQSQVLSFIYFKTNHCEHLDRSCNGGAADGESVKVETTTFEENSQTSIADNLFRWNITLKMMMNMCGGGEVSRGSFISVRMIMEL